jgi:RHS repeat-associated protein
MNPAAKHFDIVMGVDTHLIQPPGPVSPLPIPHPFIGMVFDPMDYLPKMGATIKINGLPRAIAGSAAMDSPPHIPLGGMFVNPPANQGEMFMGSATVNAEGEPLSFMSLQVLSCSDIGSPPPPRQKDEGGHKSMAMPTSVVLPIPMGLPVLVGGAPTVSMSVIGTKLAMAGFGKAMKKFKKWQKGSKLMKALSQKLRDAIDKTKLPAGLKDKLKSLVCTLTGHPVNVADGSVLTSVVDFELPGPIPFKWERSWFSNASYLGPLGHGWFHPYDMAIEIQAEEGVLVVRLPEGRLAAFPIPEEGSSSFNRKEKMTLFREKNELFLRDHDLLTYRFQKGGISSIHQLERIEDKNGFSLRFEYLNGNALSRIIDSAGRELLFATDEAGRILSIQAPHPTQSGETFCIQSYRYDPLGNLVEAKNALDQSFTYAYQGHLLVKETNRNGLSFYFDYEGVGVKAKCFRTWGDGGIYDHRLRYFEGYTEVTNSLGHITLYYHKEGLVWKTIDALGGISFTEYNEFLELISEKNPLGLGNQYQYDDQGHQVMVLQPDGATTQLSYNALHLPEKIIDPVGGVWKYRYDEKGNLIEQINSLGYTTTFLYQEGLLREMVDAAGEKTKLAYDVSHHLKMVTRPDGSTFSWFYDRLGRCVESQDPKGNRQTVSYDALGNAIEVQEPDGNIRKLSYDGEGNVLLAKDRHYEVRFEYTGMNRMKARTQGGTRVAFAYDTEEQLTHILNEQGFAYRFEHDAVGEVVEEIGFDDLRKIYVRDAAGRVEEVKKTKDKTAKYRYDPCGRIQEIIYSDGSFEKFSYREDGAMVEAVNEHLSVKLDRDVLGQVIREQQGNQVVESRYDVMGERTFLSSSLGAQFRYLRDKMGEVEQLDSGNFQVRFRRDVLGLEMEREFSGGLRSRWNRDRLGRPVKQETLTGGGFLHRSRSYQWEENDRLRQITDTKTGTTAFGYDTWGNLAWSENSQGASLFRMPDAVGNLFRTQERTDRTYGSSGQLLKSSEAKYAYDGEGNLVRKTTNSGKTWKYAWNEAGMLVSVTRPDGYSVTFTYDALGRRLSKTFRGQTTRWVWDGNTPLHEWVESATLFLEAGKAASLVGFRGGAEAKEHVTTWLFEPESFAPLAKMVGRSSYGIVCDHLGTPLSMHLPEGEMVWSADLNVYGERTNQRGKAEDCPFRYPGQYEDVETGLYYNRFRYYAPEEGMYISQDPIGLEGGHKLYSYVNDPNAWVDVEGLNKMKCGDPEKLKKLGLEGVDLRGKSFNAGKKKLEAAGFKLTGKTKTGRKTFTHPITGTKVHFDGTSKSLAGNQAPHWHIEGAGGKFGSNGVSAELDKFGGHIPSNLGNSKF